MRGGRALRPPLPLPPGAPPREDTLSPAENTREEGYLQFRGLPGGTAFAFDAPGGEFGAAFRSTSHAGPSDAHPERPTVARAFFSAPRTSPGFPRQGPGDGPRRGSRILGGGVTAEESGLALSTGSVSLYRSDGTEVLSVLTDDQGRYLLQAPAPGAYRLRAERLGYHSREKGPFTLRATDTLTVDFQLPPAPLPMDSILVSVRRRAQPLRAGEQFVYGRLLDDDGGEPIPQGLVRLLTESGASAAATLSDDEGLFWLVSPSAGSYRLQAERLGYRSSTGPEIYLMLGDTIGVDFYLSMEAVLLNPRWSGPPPGPSANAMTSSGCPASWNAIRGSPRWGSGTS